jgi:tetratricopeptide (TPR) repeat protein
LLSALADRVYEAGDAPRAESILADAIADADRVGDEGAAAMARLILTFVQSSTRSAELAESFAETERQGAILARVGDDAGARLAQAGGAFLLFAMGQAGEANRRAEALLQLERSDENWHRQARQSAGASSVWGPLPVVEAIARIERANSNDVGAYRGLSRLRALQGRFDEALELNHKARVANEDLGNRHQVVSTQAAEGEIQFHAGNFAEAERLIRAGFEAMAATGDRSYASTHAVDLGSVLLELHQDDEAWKYGTIAREWSSSDDVVSQAGGRAVQARVLSRRGEHDAAEALASGAVAIMAKTDYLERHGEALVHQAKVLQESGKADEALAAAREGLALYERKGATFFAERTRRLIDDWTA